MKTFMIELDYLENAKKDSRKKLMDYIISNKLEFWEYLIHQTIILTPDSYSVSQIMRLVRKIYGDGVMVVVFEVSIKNLAAYGPVGFMDFFDIVRHPEFIPAWERGSYDPEYMERMLEKVKRK